MPSCSERPFIPTSAFHLDTYGVLFELGGIGCLEDFDSELLAGDSLALCERIHDPALLRIHRFGQQSHVHDMHKVVATLSLDKITSQIDIRESRWLLLDDADNADDVQHIKFCDTERWDYLQDGQQNLLDDVTAMEISVRALEELSITIA